MGGLLWLGRRRAMSIGRRCLILGLLLIAADASAQTYQILGGTLSGADGRREPFAGNFAAHALIGPTPGSTLLVVRDFALQAGEQTFTPAPPVEFEGPRPLLEVGSAIEVLGNDVPTAQLRSGGEVIRSDELQVTYGFLDFRTEPSNASRAVGLLNDSVPRRLHLAGTLYEVEQSFEIQRLCLPVSDPMLVAEPDPSQSGDISRVATPGLGEMPPSREPGGSVVIRGDGGRLIPADVSIRIEILQPPPNPIPLPFCAVLWPIVPSVERAVGRFALVATAA